MNNFKRLFKKLFCPPTVPAFNPVYRALAVTLLFFAAGAASGILFFLDDIRSPGIPCSVIIDGKVYSTEKLRTINYESILNRRIEKKFTVSAGKRKMTTTWKSFGAYADYDFFKSAVKGISNPEYVCSPDLPPAEIPLPLRLDPARARENLVALKVSWDQPETDARLNIYDGSIVPHRKGIFIDLIESLALLHSALRKGSDLIELAAGKIKPLVTADKLEKTDMSATLGHFDTHYARTSEARDRTHNVLLGAEMLSGQIIMPNSTWSFNGALGERTAARGFHYAPVIAGGELVEGMGGGTCQVASTLYAAVFFAAMEIVERQPHSRPSSYIKLGLDATVAYPNIDLKIKNPHPFPVVIKYTAGGGILKAEILGKNSHHKVIFIRKIERRIPFNEKVIEKKDLPAGLRVITQLGISGFVVQRFRIINRNSVSFRERSQDKYPPTTQIVVAGTNPDLALDSPGFQGKIPQKDSHLPYHAHSRLRMIQGQDVWDEAMHE